MAIITATPDPVSVGAALSLATNTPRTELWIGQCQNANTTQTVYRVRSSTKPNPSQTAFRHLPGEHWRMTVYSDDLGATWLWTARYAADVILEEGLPGI